MYRINELSRVDTWIDKMNAGSSSIITCSNVYLYLFQILNNYPLSSESHPDMVVTKDFFDILCIHPFMHSCYS